MDHRFLRRSLRSLLAMTLLLCSAITVTFAEDATSAEERAGELHRLASSDVIYHDQEIKAIYYQNVQIIDLLKQIRDLLDSRLKENPE